MGISIERAREIASHWQSPGAGGIGMAQFASTGTITEALLDDMDRVLRKLRSVPLVDQKLEWYRDTRDLQELERYVNAQTVTVWVVGQNEAGYLPTSAPEWHLDYADAVVAFTDLVEAASDDMEGECLCGDDAEVCAACGIEAQVGGFLRDEVPSVIGRKVFGDVRPLSLTLKAESKASVAVYWVDSTEVSVAEYRAASEVSV